jgi:4'-phosphopantetheinyl transferase
MVEKRMENSLLKPTVPSLTSSTTHVWSIPLSVGEEIFPALRDVLAVDERERAARFHFERDSRRFIVARGAVRFILASYTHAEASDLRFLYSSHGKPSLADPACDIHFSVSHSNDQALLAVTLSREVGVDIEWIREDIETDKLAERFFSPREREALRGLPADKRVAAFFRCWSCKEAFLKAQGVGLSRSLDSFDVDLNVGQPARLVATRPDAAEAQRWFLRELPIAAGYAAAVAADGVIGDLRTLQYGGIEGGRSSSSRSSQSLGEKASGNRSHQ